VATDEVEIEDFAFSPATITVKAGTKVTWTNKDSTPHTVTTDSGAPESFDSGSMDKDATFSFTFTKAGTYEYICTFHPSMRGTVVVTE
jgi:amicyanin